MSECLFLFAGEYRNEARCLPYSSLILKQLKPITVLPSKCRSYHKSLDNSGGYRHAITQAGPRGEVAGRRFPLEKERRRQCPRIDGDKDANYSARITVFQKLTSLSAVSPLVLHSHMLRSLRSHAQALFLPYLFEGCTVLYSMYTYTLFLLRPKPLLYPWRIEDTHARPFCANSGREAATVWSFCRI
jgi:hypothetical protein